MFDQVQLLRLLRVVKDRLPIFDVQIYGNAEAVNLCNWLFVSNLNRCLFSADLRKFIAKIES